jgi:hypothetical protein
MPSKPGVFRSIPVTTLLNMFQVLIRLLRRPSFGGRMDLSPPHSAHCEDYTSMRIKKSPRWDDEGVAATVGTIMTILVFLTFLGVFTNQVVPVWMSDNESTHMTEAIQQIVSLKSNIDGLVADYANSLIAVPPIMIPVTLSSPGIPVFAGPTAGILSFKPESRSGLPSFNASYTSALEPDDGYTGGEVRLYCPNRYYVEQSVIYEAGAVILNQSDGEFIISGIGISVANYSGARVVQITQISLVGLNKTVGGTGAKAVNANLLYASTIGYSDDDGEDITLTITTRHGNAWANYFRKALNSTQEEMAYGSGSGGFHVPAPVFYDSPGKVNDYYVVSVTIYDVNRFHHTRASVQVSIGEFAP